MTASSEIIVVTNRKGGTGKTTTSVNIAAEFAAQGRRVLLIDMDTQGHCAVGLDIAPAKGDPTVHSLFLSSGFRLSDAVYPLPSVGQFAPICPAVEVPKTMPWQPGRSASG